MRIGKRKALPAQREARKNVFITTAYSMATATQTNETSAVRSEQAPRLEPYSSAQHRSDVRTMLCDFCVTRVEDDFRRRRSWVEMIGRPGRITGEELREQKTEHNRLPCELKSIGNVPTRLYSSRIKCRTFCDRIHLGKTTRENRCHPAAVLLRLSFIGQFQWKSRT